MAKENKAIDKVKRQINEQTRPKAGVVRLKSKATLFSDKPFGTDDVRNTPVVWDKTSYIKNRGTTGILTPSVFNGYSYGVSRTSVNTYFGNFKETSGTAYTNARFAGVAGINRGGTLTFHIKTYQSSIAVYVDNNLSLQSDVGTHSTDVPINISTKALIQIFWYAPYTTSTIEITGLISNQIDTWEQSDNTPFMMPVTWSSSPIVSGAYKDGDIYIPYVTLNFELDTANGYDTGLGGFGILDLSFKSTNSQVDQGSNYVDLAGEHTDTDEYIRVGDSGTDVYSIVSAAYYGDAITPYTRITISGTFDTALTGSETIQKGRVTLKAEKDIAGDLGDYTFSYTDWNVENGERYFYLIDTYDDSLHKNRGAMTAIFQTVEAGRTSDPTKPYFDTYERVAYTDIKLVINKDYEDGIADIRVWDDHSDTWTEQIDSYVSDTQFALADGSRLVSGMPISIYHDLNWFLEQSDLYALWYADVGVTRDGSNVVSAWANQATSGASDLAQASSTYQPTFVTNQRFGKCAVLSGGNDHMTSGAVADWSFLHNGDPVTVISVARVLDTTSSLKTLYCTGATSGTSRGFWQLYTGTNCYVYLGNGSSRINFGGGTVSSGSYLISIFTYYVTSGVCYRTWKIAAGSIQTGSGSFSPSSSNAAQTFRLMATSSSGASNLAYHHMFTAIYKKAFTEDEITTAYTILQRYYNHPSPPDSYTAKPVSTEVTHNDAGIVTIADTVGFSTDSYIKALKVIDTIPYKYTDEQDPLVFNSVIKGLSVPGTYYYWCSCRDVMANEDLTTLDSIEVELTEPEMNTLSNSTHVFSTYSEFESMDDGLGYIKDMGPT